MVKANWCQICQNKHPDPKTLPGRRKLVLGSSTLAHLWKTRGYKNAEFHVDFDFIIGGQIHDVHLSWLRQYKDLGSPFDIILACGVNNIPTSDSAEQIIFQYESFLQSIHAHSKEHNHETPNRFVIVLKHFFKDLKRLIGSNHLVLVAATTSCCNDD
jgi:hypothetical protein